jgi:hypothetical protein
VFKAEVFLVEVRALGEPVLELAGSFDDVHAGNDSGGENGKSNGGKKLFTTETQRKPLIVIVSFLTVFSMLGS